MTLAGKIFAVISLVAAVFYAGITAALLSLRENYKKMWVDEQAAHGDTKTRWENNKRDLEKDKASLEDMLKLANKHNDALRDERDQVSLEWKYAAEVNKALMRAVQDQEDQIALLNSRNDHLNDDVTAARKTIDDKDAEIKKTKDKADELLKGRDALADLLGVRDKELINATKELEKVLEQYREVNDIVERLRDYDPLLLYEFRRPGAEPGRASPKPIRGKVTGVDKALGLVILNIGQRHEVAKGYGFIVFRGDKYIGKIVVDEVFPDMSATHYVRDQMKEDVEVGDDVTTKLTIDL